MHLIRREMWAIRFRPELQPIIIVYLTNNYRQHSFIIIIYLYLNYI
uniref:Uncharacterized protein n=1 Tax=Anguilla anguilla TaxID=7936 RepID=A0A0E9R772_ANGAN